MRIGLTLENPRRETVIPLNYNQLLAACIYWALGASSTDYAEHLHQDGYAFQGKHFKLFTFSQLLAERRRIDGARLTIQSPTVRWLVSSPVDEFVMHFATGILERGRVRIGSVDFRLRDIGTLPPPEFTPTMRFSCLSPISVSTHTEVEGLNPLQYCRLEGNFYDKVVENLRRKYTLLTGQDASRMNLVMAFDPGYIARRQGRIHKLVRYKDTKIFAYLAPFTVQGDVELIRVGYECGFGDGNSKGLGMVEVDKGKPVR
ncbi:MAG TPA: CRISPR-associated endoribonuclease Cas6 [Alphaproteobacteria bacterium]|nr:CRISPR-associated endoribonuclease Cas6 [Alphaproteobacteria bacterium]